MGDMTSGAQFEKSTIVKPTMEVRFYKHDEAFGCFANFSSHPVTIGDVLWPTVEHYFQAQKFVGTDKQSILDILSAPTPKDAAAIGRDRSRPLRTDWESVKDDLMRVGVYSKLLAYDDLRDMLLGTGDAQIIEASPKDSYWGTGADGNGKNMLGKILMEGRLILLSGGAAQLEQCVEALLIKTAA
jgi:ribA/ribD-fused uncharacterized protein